MELKLKKMKTKRLKHEQMMRCKSKQLIQLNFNSHISIFNSFCSPWQTYTQHTRINNVGKLKCMTKMAREYSMTGNEWNSRQKQMVTKGKNLCDRATDQLATPRIWCICARKLNCLLASCNCALWSHPSSCREYRPWASIRFHFDSVRQFAFSS